jgi:(4S)-4-hydroxy-5-phosphonooxypentane-2,3-dione isomerase
MIRIVKMEFKQERVQDFLDLFETIKHKIRSVPGCLSVTLLQDKTSTNIFFTYSIWQQETDLNNYRDSLLFKTTWRTIKPWFCNAGTAWSVNNIDG